MLAAPLPGGLWQTLPLLTFLSLGVTAIVLILPTENRGVKRFCNFPKVVNGGARILAWETHSKAGLLVPLYVLPAVRIQAWPAGTVDWVTGVKADLEKQNVLRLDKADSREPRSF